MKITTAIARAIIVSNPEIKFSTRDVRGVIFARDMLYRSPYIYAEADNDSDCHDWEDSYKRTQEKVNHLPYKEQLEESRKLSKGYDSKCLRCGRTKEDVRFGTDPPQCNSAEFKKEIK